MDFGLSMQGKLQKSLLIFMSFWGFFVYMFVLIHSEITDLLVPVPFDYHTEIKTRRSPIRWLFIFQVPGLKEI